VDHELQRYRHITKTYNVDGPSRISHLLVIYDLLRQKAVLVDWDDARTSPTRAATHPDSSFHSPAVFVDNHGAEVDIWGVGKLIVDACAFVPGISETMVDIGTEMVQGLIRNGKSGASVCQTARCVISIILVCSIVYHFLTHL
jgi:hypothetical protein